MGTTLDHGIYLPDEGERNCYEGLAGNWVALDNHLGSTDIHVTINDKQAWNGHVADTTIHVTSADKQAWNGKADASALNAHTGDATIHVTAEDKNKWDAVTSKADDSDVVHKSGDETVNGNKTFSSINGVEPSSLSLPSGNTSDRLDISSYITAFDGTTNSYTPLANGWISISANNCTEIYVFLNNLWGVNNTQPTAGSIIVTLPVLKGIPVAIRITGRTLKFARFIPCQGNV